MSTFLCLVVYHLPAGFVPKVKKRGNAKDNSPFYPTWPSAKQQIKKHCEIKGPKDTVSFVSANAGGVLLAFYITAEFSIEILEDIFGKKLGTTYIEGLVDAYDSVKNREGH